MAKNVIAVFKNTSYRPYDEMTYGFINRIWCRVIGSENDLYWFPEKYCILEFKNPELTDYFYKEIEAQLAKNSVVIMMVRGKWIGQHCNISRKSQICVSRY